jgi:hypothetical protein
MPLVPTLDLASKLVYGWLQVTSLQLAIRERYAKVSARELLDWAI